MAAPAKISVIVPVYHAGKNLELCLRSVQAQSFEDWELICVDDGSTAEDAALLDAWAARDARIRVMHQPNGGVSAARNAGLDMAGGEYITFVDSDDEIGSSYLAELCGALEKTPCDMLVCGWTYCPRGREAEEHRVCCRIEPLQMEASVLQQLPVHAVGHVYRRSLVEQYGVRFPLGVRYGEDCVFHYCLYALCRTGILVPCAAYYYKENAQSLSHSVSRTVTDLLSGGEYLAQFYRENTLLDNHRELLLRFFAHALRRLHSMAPHAEQTSVARRLREAMCDFPPDCAELEKLRRKDARCIRSILRGGNGLSLSYYWKRCRRLRFRFPRFF